MHVHVVSCSDALAVARDDHVSVGLAEQRYQARFHAYGPCGAAIDRHGDAFGAPVVRGQRFGQLRVLAPFVLGQVAQFMQHRGCQQTKYQVSGNRVAGQAEGGHAVDLAEYRGLPGLSASP